ncbi:MAG TPA: hypothetical protein VEP71_01910 [Gallionella sp.]|nr:hypothetical protein [Gallionella sp.]
MAKPNYTYEKRQKELAKKQKQEQKRQKKAALQGGQPQDSLPPPLVDETATT